MDVTPERAEVALEVLRIGMDRAAVMRMGSTRGRCSWPIRWAS